MKEKLRAIPEKLKAHRLCQAAASKFDENEHQLSPQTTIEDVFRAVQSGSADRGVVPFENSTNGAVIFTLDLLADVERQLPDITVCAEIYIRVHHCLVGFLTSRENVEDPSRPLAHQQPDTNVTSQDQPWAELASPLGHVKKLYSHPQVWGQCQRFLSKHLRGAERFDASSTSRAAELAAQDATGHSAAISSSMAADEHRLQCLAQNIEDTRDNTTRFFVLKKVDPSPSSGSAEPTDQGGDGDEDGMRSHKSLVSLSVGHEHPGSLADCLAVFKSHDLSLTSINARPSRMKNWQYVFLVEIKGRRLGEGIGAVNAALCELDNVATNKRWLGSWENGLE